MKAVSMVDLKAALMADQWGETTVVKMAVLMAELMAVKKAWMMVD